MPELYLWFLMLHILGAILAFGPTYIFPIIGSMGGKEPQHANFATRVSLAITQRMSIPVAITMPVTGVLIIWSRGIDVVNSRWLLVGIVLYAIALGYVLAIQAPAGKRVIELTTVPPAVAGAGVVAGAMPAAGVVPAAGAVPAAPAGPPPGLPEAVKKVQRGGMFLQVLIAVIVILMVVKPF